NWRIDCDTGETSPTDGHRVDQSGNSDHPAKKIVEHETTRKIQNPRPIAMRIAILKRAFTAICGKTEVALNLRRRIRSQNFRDGLFNGSELNRERPHWKLAKCKGLRQRSDWSRGEVRFRTRLFRYSWPSFKPAKVTRRLRCSGASAPSSLRWLALD